MEIVDQRLSTLQYFMKLTHIVAERSTCLRRQVGALAVMDKRILATGYNGAPSGIDHCISTGCLRQKLNIPSGERHEICRGVHAEQNVIIQAATYGVSLKGAELYCTTYPCIICTKMIINCGIKRVICAEMYPKTLQTEDMFASAGVEVIFVNNY